MTAKRNGRGVAVAGVAALLLAAWTLAAKKAPTVATQPLDDGRLVPAWFGPGVAFVEADDIDYLWVKAGFTVAGKSLFFAPWPAPEFIGKDAARRDTDDTDLARQMNATMPDILAREWGAAWKGIGVTTSTTSGEIRVDGRIVDCSTGSRAAKVLVGFGAGAGFTVVDVKFSDAATGELLVAMHHRVVSGTTWSTTDSKFKKWVRSIGEEIAKKGFATVYAKGDAVSK